MSENESSSTLGVVVPVAGVPRSADGGSEPVKWGLDPAMAELLEIFEGPLREATFPEVSRDALRSLAADVDASLVERDRKAALVAEAEAALAEAEAAVAAARAGLREAEAATAERQRALLARGQRALSYAKVYAETDPGLHARLSAISLARIAQRGRPPSSDARRVASREPRTQPVEVATSDTSAHAPAGTARGRGRRTVASTDAEPVELSASG